MTKTRSLYLALVLAAAPAAASQLGAEAPRAKIPTLTVALPGSAASFASPLSAPRLNKAPAQALAVPQAAVFQAQAMSVGVSAAEQKGESPKESLDQAFERSVAEAKGGTAPVVPQSQPPGPALSPSDKPNTPSAPQPPAPKGPKGFWQKHGDAITGGTVGAILLAASALILGPKSLAIPAFAGLLAALVPFVVRGTSADGKPAYIPIWAQSVIGGAMGLVTGWVMSRFGFSTAMAGYGLMTGIFVPRLIQGLLKPTYDGWRGRMFLSLAAGAGIGATLPVWLGAKYGRKLFGKRSAK